MIVFIVASIDYVVCVHRLSRDICPCAVSPMETGFAEKRMQFQDQQYLVDRRLGSLEQPPRPVGKRSRQGGVTTPSRAGYGLLTVILVAFLAFIIGQISQGYLSQQLGTSDGVLFELGAKLHKAVLEIMSRFQK